MILNYGRRTDTCDLLPTGYRATLKYEAPLDVASLE